MADKGEFYVAIPNGQLAIHHAGLVDFLGRNGFAIGKYNSNTQLIRIQDNVIRETSVQEIIQFVNSYVNCLPDNLGGGHKRSELKNLLVRGSRTYFDKVKFDFLPLVDIAVNRDSKDSAYVYFENCFTKVTATDVSVHEYPELCGLIWAKQINARMFTKSAGETGSSVIEQFLFNVCNKEEARFRSLKSLIGYLLHSYKDLSLAKVIVLVDEEIGELGDANGGTGKSIIAKAIIQMKSGVLLPGKNFDIDKSFAFQRVEHGTDVIVIDDARRNEKFERFYNIITEGITVERKHRGEFFIPFEYSPKLCITTNYVLQSPEGNSSDRRKIEFEVSPFYNREHRPEMDFGHTLFEDWDTAEWNKFFNAMLGFMQFYLQNGIIEPPKINITLRKLYNDTGAEFVEFMDDKILEGVKKFHKKETHEEFIVMYPGLRKFYPSTNKFTKKMKRYFNDKNIEFTEHPAATKKYFIIDGNTGSETPTNSPQGKPVVTETPIKPKGKLINSGVSEEPLRTINDTTHSYTVIKTKSERDSLIRDIISKSFFAFDTETTGLDPHTLEIVGLAISVEPHTAFYIPLPETFPEAQSILREFQPLFESEAIEKIAHNLKYDMQVLMRYGIAVNGNNFDTMIAHYLCAPDLKQHGLKQLCKTLFNYQQVLFEDIVGKGENQRHIWEVPLEQLAEYAAEDVDFTLQLKLKLLPELQRLNLFELFRDIEMPLVPVLARMEFEGVNLNVNHLSELLKKTDREQAEKAKEIYKIAGEEFNIGSAQQLNRILFTQLGIKPSGAKGKSGYYSTDGDTLQELADTNPIVPLIIDYKEQASIRSNFLEKLPTMVNSVTGRIHTNFNQTVAATGRLSSSEPNLQNVPKKMEGIGSLIRQAFIPRDSAHCIVAADYSQIELRVMAHLSNDTSLVNAFLNDQDVHSATAAKLFGVPLGDISKDDYRRKIAKSVNFGLNYGMTEFGLAKRLTSETGKLVTQKEAKSTIESYFENFEGVKKFIDDAIFNAICNGYALTLFNRRRELTKINSGDRYERESAKRIAVNMPVQGTAADVIKIAMVKVDAALVNKKMNTKMILQIHDELVFDVPKSELEEALVIIKSTMEAAATLSVPLKADIGHGGNWLVAH